MIALITSCAAAVFFAAWVITSIGGRQQRDDLRQQLAEARVELALHEIGREIRAELRTLDTRPVAAVVPIRRGES